MLMGKGMMMMRRRRRRRREGKKRTGEGMVKRRMRRRKKMMLRNELFLNEKPGDHLSSHHFGTVYQSEKMAHFSTKYLFQSNHSDRFSLLELPQLSHCTQQTPQQKFHLNESDTKRVRNLKGLGLVRSRKQGKQTTKVRKVGGSFPLALH